MICVNGIEISPPDDARVSLLDLLREHLDLTGTKKGCDQGACGACTVLLDGDRVLSCLTLAAQAEGRDVRTIEGLSGESDDLHPLQRAFVEHDGLQCGYCTPGQICSAVGMLAEVGDNWPSHATADVTGSVSPTEDEIRERMSGNLCRCSAYPQIIEAIRAAAGEPA